MSTKSVQATRKSVTLAIDSNFAHVARAIASDRQVTCGNIGLKVNGKISSRMGFPLDFLISK
jgi:hypothetical protein